MSMNVLDLFCGCGGISYGFKLAGFNIAGGIDHDEDSVLTFAKNFPNSIAPPQDLTDYSDQKILSDFGNKNIDILVGGPPCQGFSSANRWQKEESDPRNKLFFDFIRVAKLLKPKVILVENVRGILSKNNGYAKNRILSLFDELGFFVDCKVLNASLYGVPQVRHRAFFIGIRKDFSVKFQFEELKELKKVTVSEAISELYDLKSSDTEHELGKPTNSYTKYLRKNSSSVLNHEIRYPALSTQEKIKHVPQGGNWQDIPQDLFPRNRNNRHSSAFKRLKESECSVTIDTGNAHSNYFHPIFNRIPTVREAARLQSFPDNFEFLGSRTSQYRQVGNAVPPLLAKAIADQIKITLK